MGKTIITILGVVFVAIGILGFIPGLTPDDQLLGIFAINPIHNIIHLASGIAALAAVSSSPQATRLYAQVFGVVYALVTVLGFISGEGDLLGLVSINQADNFLHLAIAALVLYIGFGEESGSPQKAAA